MIPYNFLHDFGKKLILCIAVAAAIFSCEDRIEISRGEDFTLTAEPYRTTISKGETREITLNIESPSTYTGTVYRIRYYQTEGEGTLAIDDGRTMREGQDYLLSSNRLTIRYTSAAETDHSFTVTVSDNIGHSHNLEIELATR